MLENVHQTWAEFHNPIFDVFFVMIHTKANFATKFIEACYILAVANTPKFCWCYDNIHKHKLKLSKETIQLRRVATLALWFHWPGG
jgi:hypothetical protein